MRSASVYPRIHVFSFQPCRTIIGRIFKVIMPFVLNPFEHIAAHVVQAKFVGLFQTNWVSFIFRIFIVPPYFVQSIATGILETSAQVAPLCRKFPFSLSGQAVTGASHLPQFFKKWLGVPPGYTFHWTVVAALKMRGIIAHYLNPLTLCNGKLTNEKIFDPNRVNRFFEIHSFFFAHFKCASVNFHHQVLEGVTVFRT